MMKKALFAAASVAALASAPAHAGELNARITDVNVLNGAHPGVDLNSYGGSCDVADGLRQDLKCGFTSDVTIDSTEYWAVDGHPPIPTIVFATERFVGPDHPVKAHYEVDLYDSEDVFTEEAEVRIRIGGGAFKDAFSPNQIIRGGSDNTYSDSAFGFGLTPAGATESTFIVNTNSPESAIGFVLPLMFTTPDTCNLTVDFSVARQVAGTTFHQTTDPLLLATCADSFASDSLIKEVHVDYRQSFKGFLVPAKDFWENDGSRTTADFFFHGKPIFVQSDWADVGSIGLWITNNMVNPKQAIVNSEAIRDRYVDITDISKWDVELQFENLMGIKSVELIDKISGASVYGALDYDTNKVTYSITAESGMGQLLRSNERCTSTAEALYNEGKGSGGHQQHCLIHIRVHAWGEGRLDESALAYFPDGSMLAGDEYDPGDGKTILVPIPGTKGEKRPIKVNGAIQHQAIYLTRSEATLSPNNAEVAGSLFDPELVKFDTPLKIAEGHQVGKLKVNGQVFGPFDWVGDTTLPVKSAFRITGLPSVDGHGNTIENYEGVITLENSSKGSEYDGDYKFSIPASLVVNGEMNIMPGRFKQLLEAGGAPIPANYGRTDVTFNWFVESVNVDMDRLLNTNGTFSDFGDNGNDSNSEHAISGDDGRFGPKKGGKIIFGEIIEQ